MLIDRATIFVRSGKGGDGCVSFRREKYVPKGGPDGGDGGKGGDVILVGDGSVTTLLPLTPRPHYRATNGRPGMGKSMHGADGDDRVVAVPLGTLVYDADGGDLLVDISEAGERFVVARGGRGGFGNEHFKSATNQTPREATPGEAWEERTLRLELKLIADVGLVGLPNAGKSTMLRAISRATPRVAAYPFTTLHPHLGIAQLPGERRLVVADIPGLIRGAADGAGLGHDFLRHVERTKVLVHMLDLRPADDSDPVDNYETIRRELYGYSPLLAEKPEVIVINKSDLVPDAAERESLVRRIAGRLGVQPDDLLLTCGATGEGTRELLEACWQALGSDRPDEGWSGRATG
ncbi:MAG: GTPase ObgE [Planctomycetota bacterium]|jgi:GTP-binding protein